MVSEHRPEAHGTSMEKSIMAQGRECLQNEPPHSILFSLHSSTTTQTICLGESGCELSTFYEVSVQVITRTTKVSFSEYCPNMYVNQPGFEKSNLNFAEWQFGMQSTLFSNAQHVRQYMYVKPWRHGMRTQLTCHDIELCPRNC